MTDLVRGHHHIQALEVPYGYLDAAYFRSTGKVLLAFASEEVRRLYYRTHEMKSRTPHSVKSFDLLDSQLHDVRSVGYAIDREEFALGVCCVAMPLDGGASPLSIGVSAPTERFDKNFERYLALLKQILANP